MTTSTSTSASSSSLFTSSSFLVVALTTTLVVTLTLTLSLPFVLAPSRSRRRTPSAPSSSSSFEPPRGFTNLGNTCFLSSLLQALSHCSSFTRYLDPLVCSSSASPPPSLALSAVDNMQRQRQTEDSRLLSLVLSRLLSCLKGDVSAVHDLYRHLCALDRVWIGHAQQDCHELFVAVMELCERAQLQLRSQEGTEGAKEVANANDCASVFTPPSPRLLPYSAVFSSQESATIAHEQSSTAHLLEVKGRMATASPFVGFSAHFLECTHCSYRKAIQHARINAWTLVLPINTNVTLEQCWREWARPEHVDEVICAYCSTCTQLEDCSQELLQLRAELGSRKEQELMSTIERLLSQKERLRLGMDLADELESKTRNIRKSDKRRHLLNNKLERREMLKCTRIARAPQSLCLHLNRLMSSEKIVTHVQFGQQLDLMPYMVKPTSDYVRWSAIEETAGKKRDNGSAVLAEENVVSAQDDLNPYVYRLVAVIEHQGLSGRGHFIAYCRHTGTNNVESVGNSTKDDDLWLRASDANVTLCSWSEVAQINAYMLFYERLPPARAQSKIVLSAKVVEKMILAHIHANGVSPETHCERA